MASQFPDQRTAGSRIPGFLLAALAVASCGSKGDESAVVDSTAVAPAMTAADTTIKTDTVKVAGDTAR
jgi:hypothetical protein